MKNMIINFLVGFLIIGGGMCIVLAPFILANYFHDARFFGMYFILCIPVLIEIGKGFRSLKKLK